MNIRSSLFLAVALLAGTVATVQNAQALGRISNVYTTTGRTSDPSPVSGYRGSYVKTQVLWGDGIQHIGEVGTQINTVYYVTGPDYTSCHNALVAEASANYASNWTDCSPI